MTALNFCLFILDSGSLYLSKFISLDVIFILTFHLHVTDVLPWTNRHLRGYNITKGLPTTRERLTLASNSIGLVTVFDAILTSR